MPFEKSKKKLLKQEFKKIEQKIGMRLFRGVATNEPAAQDFNYNSGSCDPCANVFFFFFFTIINTILTKNNEKKILTTYRV